MFRTEIGVKVYEHGDVVTIRTGKVTYTVQGVTEERGELILLSNNIGRNGNRVTKVVETEADLNLVTNIRDTDEWKANEEFAAFPDLEIQANEESAEAAAEYREGHEYPSTEEPVKEDTPYQKAVLLALNLKGKHVYAGTVRANVKAKRRSLNKRQDQSRKANR